MSDFSDSHTMIYKKDNIWFPIRFKVINDSVFIDRCLDKHYICEPFCENGYEVSFSCEDICFQFKRYILMLKRIDKNYISTNINSEYKKVVT